MIYDRLCTICELPAGASPLARKLHLLRSTYCAPQEVYHARYWESVQAGDRIDLVLELPQDAEITADNWVLYNDHVWRVLQAQHGIDALGLPISRLSLRRMEENYDVLA